MWRGTGGRGKGGGGYLARPLSRGCRRRLRRRPRRGSERGGGSGRLGSPWLWWVLGGCLFGRVGAWSLELGVGHDVAVVVVVSIDKDLGAGPRYVHNLYAETWASPILQLPASKFRIVHRNEAQTSSTPKIDSKSSATSITLQMNEIEDGGNRRVFKMATLLM